MQGIRFWIMQYLLAAVTMFALLAGVEVFSGRTLGDGMWMTLAWAMAFAAIFIGARYSQSRKR